jgi:hypothetical protein
MEFLSLVYLLSLNTFLQVLHRRIIDPGLFLNFVFSHVPVFFIKSFVITFSVTQSFSSVVESQNMNLEDPELVNVLEQENIRLEKRIKVCKSRVMLVTSFDILPQRSKL